MKIDKDSIFFFVWQPISDAQHDLLFKDLQNIAKAAADNASKVGILPGRTFKTMALSRVDDRYFKTTFNFRGIPFTVLRCQVDEINEKQYKKTLERHENDPTKTTDWI